MAHQVSSRFPGLKDWSETSPTTSDYNCIAWAAEDSDRWWWPDDPEDYFTSYWPECSRRDDSIECFVEAFSAHLGYETCVSEVLEAGFQKVAIYVGANGRVTHMARQLESGRWTSKLGQSIDIEHGSLAELGGKEYGSVAQILRRPAQRS